MVSDEFVLNPDLITQGRFFSFFALWELSKNMKISVDLKLGLLVLFRTFAGAAEVLGGAEHP